MITHCQQGRRTMKKIHSILVAGALSLAVPSIAFAQQGGQSGGGGVPDRKSSAAKAKTQATVQGGGQGGGTGQVKAGAASKKGTQATVQGGGQGGGTTQMKS